MLKIIRSLFWSVSFADLRWALLPCSRARRLPAHAMRSRKLEKEWQIIFPSSVLLKPLPSLHSFSFWWSDPSSTGSNGAQNCAPFFYLYKCEKMAFFWKRQGRFPEHREENSWIGKTFLPYFNSVAYEKIFNILIGNRKMMLAVYYSKESHLKRKNSCKMLAKIKIRLRSNSRAIDSVPYCVILFLRSFNGKTCRYNWLTGF